MNLSPAWLFGSLVVSTIGLGLFLYGKRAARAPQLVVGLALMLYPAVVASLTGLFVIGGALVLGLWIALRMGL